MTDIGSVAQDGCPGLPLAAGGRPAVVQVVDDDALVRRLIGAQLKPLGCRLVESGDGASALESIRVAPPDLILLDVGLPGLDGFELCRALKSDPRTRLVPVVMITGLDSFEDRLRGLEVGADEFLTKPYRAEELKTRVRALLSLKYYTDELENAEAVLQGMARIVEIRDGYTGDHCRRVGELTGRVAAACGLGAPECRILRLGGLFHDLGKVAVSDSLLRKPSALTPDELATLRDHPVVGADLCRPMRSLGGVLPLIRHHHERLDGTGYPDGLRDGQIPVLVRILTVCDIFDALRTRRPYKEALPEERCLAVLREEAERGWWDREIVEILARLDR